MATEEQIQERWRTLTREKQQQVLEFVEELQSQPECTEPESEYIPQTPLAKKLWEIRAFAIASPNAIAELRRNRTGTCRTPGRLP